jgi:tetratricopeptide (TPR) repeat protein
MYLKTPKRYSGGGRSRRGGGFISLKRLVFLVVMIGLIVVGIGVYENRDMLRPYVEEAAGDMVNAAQDGVNQMRATPVPPTQDPTNDLTLANNAWQRGAMGDAALYYENAINALPNDVIVHYRLTMSLINQGNYDKALDYAEDTITANPFWPDAWAIHAMALNRIDASAQAIASAQRALELVPEAMVRELPDMASSRARALAFLGEAYLNLGNGELARSYINRALELYPESFEALQVRGRINQEVNFDNASALSDYSEAYDIAPNMPYLAIWVARLSDDEAALEMYQDLLQQNPGNPVALFELGSYYFRVEGNLSEANSYFNRCVDADPNNAQCLWLLGRTLLDAESQIFDPTQAVQYIQRAHDITPDNGYYLYWLAQAYMDLGECQRALPYMENGMRIAQEVSDQGLIDAFDFALGQARPVCGVPGTGGTETQQPTEPPPVDSEDA